MTRWKYYKFPFNPFVMNFSTLICCDHLGTMSDEKRKEKQFVMSVKTVE